jgi:hypothetical protein
MEDEEMAAERISADDLLCSCRQTVKRVAQIGRAVGEKHLRAMRQADHASTCMARSTREAPSR